MYVGYDIHWDTGFTLTPVHGLTGCDRLNILGGHHYYQTLSTRLLDMDLGGWVEVAQQELMLLTLLP